MEQIMKKIRAVKKKYNKLSVAALVAVMTAVSAFTANAADVDFSGGVREITSRLTTQFKAVAGSVFALGAIVCLAFTAKNAASSYSSYRRGENWDIKPIIGCAIGTVICGFASGTAFFGWFGL